MNGSSLGRQSLPTERQGVPRARLYSHDPRMSPTKVNKMGEITKGVRGGVWRRNCTSQLDAHALMFLTLAPIYRGNRQLRISGRSQCQLQAFSVT